MKHNDHPIIEVGQGVAREEDSFATGEKAARRALASIICHPISAVLVFASVRYDLEELLSGIRRVVGEVPMLGLVTVEQKTASKTSQIAIRKAKY
jgi:hypothetical protein